MSRKKINFGKHVGHRIPNETYKLLTEFADRQGVSTSTIVRNALDFYLQKQTAA